MKLKHTQAKKARRGPNITAGYPYGLSVFERRIRNLIGADWKQFSANHPQLDHAVEGYKSRMNTQRAVGRARSSL